MTALVTTLGDVLIAVRSLLSAVGDLRDPNTNPGGVELLLGEKFLKQNGAPPRLVCVCEEGTIGPVLAVGQRQVFGIKESVRCYVWGVETSDDATRNADARARVMRLLNAFKAVAPGRLEGGRLVRGMDSHVLTYGEEYQLELSYSWGVPYDEDIWRAAYALAPSPALSPPDPDRPSGDTGISFVVNPTTSPTRP